jgi:hypothetical protein
MAIPSTLALAVYKEFYDDNYVDLIYQKNPLSGMIPKRAGYGKYVDYPVKYGYTPGLSADFATAAANQSVEITTNFQVPYVKNYAVETVQNVDVELSSNDVGAFVNVLTDGLKGAMRAAGQTGETQLFGNGTGQLSSITSNTGAGPYVLTLPYIGDMYKFGVGQTCVTATNATSATDTGSFTITAVDVGNQQLTVTANGGWTPTNAHLIFRQGDYSTAGSTKLALFGLDAWFPVTRTGLATSFCNVTRSNAPDQLAGNYVDGRGLPLVVAFNKAAMRLLPWDAADPDTILVSTTQYGNLRDQLDSKARYVNVQGKGLDVYYRGIEVDVGNTTATVFPCPKLTDDRAYVLTMSTLKLHAPGNQFIKPTPLASTASGYVDTYNDDSVQIRQRLLGAATCSAPIANAVVQLQ